MSILKWNLKYFYVMPIIALLLGVIGAMQAPKLKVNMDLSGLLSDTNPAVLEMNHVSDIVGGGGYLIVLVGPTVSPEKYLGEISKGLVGVENIKYSYYERETYQLRDKALYLLPKRDFRKLNEQVYNLFNEKKLDTTGLDLFEEDYDHEDVQKEAKEFFNALKVRTNTDQYFLSKDKKYAMLLVKPTFSSTDLALSEKLVSDVEKTILKVEGKKFPYILSGRYVESIKDKEQFDVDIAKTSLIATISLFVVLFLGLGSFRAGVFTMAGVFIAMGQTVGLAYLLVGNINILTGFLLAILSGLGSEYGIHFVRRYFQERQSGTEQCEAIEKTYLSMGRTLLSAALTSASAFFILFISDFKGFSELGIIAGVGVVSIYLTFMCIFPLGARYLPNKRSRNIQERFSRLFYSFPFKTKYVSSFIILFPLIIYGISRAYFEFDFERLHNFSKETQKINQLTDELYGRAITPSAILTRNTDQAIDLEAWLNSEENEKIIDMAISYNTVMPDDMNSRYKRISKLNEKLLTLDKEEVEAKTGLKFSQIQRWVQAKPYSEEIIPRSLKDNFGPEKNILLVFPKQRQGTYENINNYAHVLNKAKELFVGMEVGSDTLVFSAILHHIIVDGRFVIILFLVGAFFVFLPDFRSVRKALILEGQLVCGGLFLVGLMGLVDEPFTILNVAVIPAVLAAGIDMGVHQMHNEIEHEGKPVMWAGKRGEALSAAKRISGPVHLGMLSSLCGFGALLFAEAKMLQGIGWIAMLGQVSMYLVSMIVFPTMKDYIYSLKNHRSEKRK